MSDKGKCWSTDNETFNYESLDDLLASNDELVAGDTIYVGEPIGPSTTQLCDAEDVLDVMRDRAYDLAGEHADGYPDVTEEAEDELNALLEAWMNKHCLPHFYTVRDVRPYILTEEDVPKMIGESV
jgi:hypothetical protein